jgi:uncharacterized protein (DUF2126 family)
MWRDSSLFSDEAVPDKYTQKEASAFANKLVEVLNFPKACLIPAYEDVFAQAQLEQKLPENIDPLKVDLKDSEERRRLARFARDWLGRGGGLCHAYQASGNQKGQYQ